MNSSPTSTNQSLAKRLGEVPHVSPLLRQIEQLSGCPPNQLGEWLLKAAVSRGASHYQREFAASLPKDYGEISNEEIGVALCSGSLSYDPVNIRAASQLLSSPSTDAKRLTHLARMERIEPVLLHIAATALPHWTRLTSHTGVTAFGGPPLTKWLHRKEPAK